MSSSADSTAKGEQEFLPLIPVPRGKSKNHLGLLLVIGGVVLCAAGLVLGLVPGAPGVFLGIPGLFMIGIGLPPVGRWINRQEAKLSPKWRRRLRPKLWRKVRRKVLDAQR